MKHRSPRFRFSSVAVVLCCAGVVAAGSRRVEAQGDVPSAQNPRAIVTETDAYLVGSPLPLAGAHARAYPDPRGRYVLFTRDQEALPPAPVEGQSTTGRASLSLYDSLTQRITELWTTNPPLGGTGSGTVTKVEWFSGAADAALIVTREDPGPGSATSDQKPEYKLLCLHPANGSQRGLKTLLRSESRLVFARSPTAPYAVVTEAPAEGAAIETGTFAPRLIVDDRGQIGPVLHLDTDFLGVEWSADGKTLFASVQVPHHTIAVDATTGEVRTISELPRNRMISPSLVHPAQPKSALPFRIVTDPITSTLPEPPSSASAHIKVQLTPLYLQYTGGVAPASASAPPLNASVFLADNGTDAVILADLSAVVYTAHDALYAVPIVHETHGDLEKSTRLALKLKAELRLKTIASAISQYVGDSDSHHFPPGGEGLAAALKSYLSDATLLGSGFTYLLNGDAYPGDAAASTLVVATLAGPGGRAVLTGDGNVRWEDAP